jgi:hypothetical protein
VLSFVVSLDGNCHHLSLHQIRWPYQAKKSLSMSQLADAS